MNETAGQWTWLGGLASCSRQLQPRPAAEAVHSVSSAQIAARVPLSCRLDQRQNTRTGRGQAAHATRYSAGALAGAVSNQGLFGIDSRAQSPPPRAAPPRRCGVPRYQPAIDRYVATATSRDAPAPKAYADLLEQRPGTRRAQAPPASARRGNA